LSFINHAEINKSKFDFEGTKANGVKDKKNLINTAFLFERTIFGAENTFRLIAQVYPNGIQAQWL
jgi:hypothetical protein